MKRYGKPVIYDEMGYEGNLQQNWGNLSAFEVVNRFWDVYTHRELMPPMGKLIMQNMRYSGGQRRPLKGGEPKAAFNG